MIVIEASNITHKHYTFLSKMIKRIIKRGRRLLTNNHVVHWLYYYRRTSPSNIRDINRVYIILPIVTVVLFGLRGIFYFLLKKTVQNNKQENIYLVSAIIPKNIRTYMEVCFASWCVLQLGCNLIEVCVQAKSWHFLQLLFAEYDELVQLRQLTERQQFLKLRDRVILLIWLIINSISSTTFVVLVISSYFEGVFNISVIISVGSAFSFSVYCYYVCYGKCLCFN